MITRYQQTESGRTADIKIANTLQHILIKIQNKFEIIPSICSKENVGKRFLLKIFLSEGQISQAFDDAD